MGVVDQPELDSETELRLDVLGVMWNSFLILIVGLLPEFKELTLSLDPRSEFRHEQFSMMLNNELELLNFVLIGIYLFLGNGTILNILFSWRSTLLADSSS